MSLCLIFLTCIANSQQSDTDGFSVIAPLASRSLLLDGIVKGGKFVVVGERGHILLSGDGYDWRQVEVPTQSTLTGVCFIDGNLGWAVGHDAVILKTTNGGQHWDKVHYEPEAEAPLLDVWFGDEHHGIAIGAYGNYLVSHDGGATWIRSELNVLDEGDPDEGDTEDTPDKDEFTGEYQLHLNAIAQSDAGQLYIVAEAGRIYRSDNSGESWSEMPSPYIGSLFGVLPLSGNTVFVYGLRGHLYRSDDAGLTWQKMETGTMEMLTDGIRLSDGKIVIAGMGGALLVSPDNGASFALIQQSNRTGYAAVMEEDTQNLLMVGDGGINHIKLIGTY
ncbi:MAG: hypothetical protein A2W28_09840 [Gammaproteobacteria bacterium RBG_16_51_14]|nr:MAG: hypothetical protein A2W28_09840 [Gammaproteobacteria bacterium RBG_16_51_14]